VVTAGATEAATGADNNEPESRSDISRNGDRGAAAETAAAAVAAAVATEMAAAETVAATGAMAECDRLYLRE